jgi:signal transduction histidine kinase
VSRTKSWVLALGADGEVLGVAEGAPRAWIGKRLVDHAGAPPAVREAARALVAEVRRGSGSIARAVVDVAELDATIELVTVPAVGLHRIATDVRALLRHASTALERQARALDVELSMTVDPGVPAAIDLDPEKIAWAVSALIGNAMRYVRHGTRQMPGGSITVTASLDEAADVVVVTVADDGPGIAAELRDRLFHRAPGAPLATGLALVVVRDIVTAHGGTLDLTTSTGAIDHGTTVTMRIPAGSA